ncbi:Na+/H+ antiporter subunit D [Marinobacter adhaerens]|uniref:Na+/H+ antiporter subunit D n=3 Tax=Marinobacter TaxID=2742 RepID=A0A3D8H746_9GAMM|nr:MULTISPECIES: Na+/H+ antiporter subunit D [Marinobacter]MCR9187159.1 Na+/H+ antiporter subunit D [Alteromonadaceae bacterium]MCW8978572.1 Na+/H+ antiporter subunit D [Marinobacter sp.]ADP98354.1 monovalent cation/H+ antiporter subunit D [Marinobacter adhaerens HP15]MBW3226215.1 Na+/H+ antiporter subunit D [Marinobacter adhaerens]MBW4977133.1 Na+/H+ antiporter subunit D [Marinobacter adhaerens]
MNPELVLPILIPLTAGALSLAFWRSITLQRVLAVVATGLLLAAGIWLMSSTIEQGFLVVEMGSWPAPFSIVLVSDVLGAIMIVLTGIIGLAIAIYSLASTPKGHEKFGYYPLMHLLLAGVAGAFLTGDIFNLFVWFEVMLLASFALLTLGGERAQMEGAIKYVTLNLFSSAIFLSAVGLLYGMVGTLNMADIAQKLNSVEDPGMVTVVSLMFMVSFGIKAAAFPLFFWLPASYHTPQVAVSALFAGLLTKVGVYALYRVFTLIFTQDVAYTHTILLWAAALTMLTGVLGAAAQFEFRRILSFHIVSQIGYMLLGLALFTPLALIGGVFYIMHHIIVKTNLFLVSGITYRLLGSYELKNLGGVYRQRPYLALLFLIPALSLAGIPPLSGFFAKFIVVKASLEASEYVISAIALLVGLLTLYSMIKIWAEVFWKKVPDHVTDVGRLNGEIKNTHNWAYYVPVVGLAACTLIIGLYGQPIYVLAETAADQLMNPQLYIEAVLGGTPK